MATSSPCARGRLSVYLPGEDELPGDKELMSSLRSWLVTRLSRQWKMSIEWLRGCFQLTLRWHVGTGGPIRDLAVFQWRIPFSELFIQRREFSQNREDGMIAAIFAMVGTTNRYFVEFGVEDGIQCNRRYLMKRMVGRAC